MRIAFAVLWLVSSLMPLRAAEKDALAIDANLRAVHMPFGTVLDPMYSTATGTQLTGYTRCGDSALWTGAYLAAEAFRYNVTRSTEALENVRAAFAGMQALSAVTGDNRLARCLVPINSPYAEGIAREEIKNTIYRTPNYLWVDNTSRDQITGAFFGLCIAFDLVDDQTLRTNIGNLVTLLLGYISRHQWSPNDDPTSTFQLRPEALQMLLQVARHVNPANTVSGPFLTLPVGSAVAFDTLDNGSYFKFNLDYLSFYHLLKFQNNGDNRDAYQTLRRHTASHQNAFFNMIDRAINGPDAVRDSETRVLLDQWLTRPRRDTFVDVTRDVPVCGGEACSPLPVPQRVTTDFLWQRSPFQLVGGGNGFIEGAGVDYLLPYWMARYYGVLSGGPIQSAAAQTATIAPASLATWFGSGLASSTAISTQQPPPFTLAGVTISVTDSSGNSRPAMLTYVSPTQINFIVPEGTAPGTATVSVNTGQTATAVIGQVTPALFSMNGAGSGVAAATAIQTQAANPALQSPVPVFQCAASGCTSVPISLGIDTPIYVTFYGTGLRNRTSLTGVTLRINGIMAPVTYAGPSPAFAGLDQVNVALPLTLRGAGEASVVLTVDGAVSNTVSINIR